MIFASLEDETGLANIIVWPKVFEANRRIVLGARMMAVKGEVQKEGLVVHLIALEVFDMTPELEHRRLGHDIGDAAPLSAPMKARPGHTVPIPAVTKRQSRDGTQA